MDQKTLERLRPKDASAAEIAASIERMQAVLLELRAEVAALEAARRGVLISGSNADVDKHDHRIRSLRLDVERIEAAIDALRPDLAVARGRERLVRLEKLEAAADQAYAAYRSFWTTKYEVHARAIADGVTLGDQAEAAGRAYAEAAETARRDPNVTAAGGVPVGQPTGRVLAYVGQEGKAPAHLIYLPATEPGLPIFWPRGHTLQPVLLTGEAACYVR